MNQNPGAGAPRPVEEELRPSPGCVTPLLQQMAGTIARGQPRSQGPAATTDVESAVADIEPRPVSFVRVGMVRGGATGFAPGDMANALPKWK